MGARPAPSALELAEFVTAVSAAADERGAIGAAVTHATRVLGVAAAVADPGGVLAADGLEPGALAPAAVAELAAGEPLPRALPGDPRRQALALPVAEPGLALVLVAEPDRTLSAEEADLARAMAGALGTTLRLLRTVARERGLRELGERQAAENARLAESVAARERLLERLARIQGAIVSSRDPQQLLEAIVAGARELLGDETSALRLIDTEDPAQLIVVASSGVEPELLRDPRTAIGVGAGGLAVAEDRLVVIEDYAADDRALASFAAAGVRTAVAAPVREQGEVIGSLTVASRTPGRRYSQAEREMLTAFAEHASIALSDARAVEDAIHQAFHDSLTGLPNRLLLRDRLEQALARTARTGARVAVLFVDLDAFKQVNDSFGHATGDKVLREAAARLRSSIRAADTAARFGGDEFVVLLEDVDEASVTSAANRVLEQMERPFLVQGRELAIGASIGIAVGSERAEDLLRQADLALYRAKSRGKGQKQIYAPEMHVAAVDRLELERALSRALSEAQLELHYQPIVDLVSRRRVAVEALVRWHHPTRGLLMPGEFIPLAEGGELIGPLGRWVLEAACAEVAAWRTIPGWEDLALHVNLSPAQLNEPELVAEIQAAVAGGGLAPAQLVLELGERALLRDGDVVARRLQQISALGVRLAVDDFGTGNASLRHLARFPIDVLKVDRSFVSRIGIDRRQTTIAGSIIGLGESLEMEVIAEGIESADQLAQLLALGCELGQGYHLARPAPAVEIEPLLAAATPPGIRGANGDPASAAA